MSKQIMDAMQPGIKYAGYGIINEFREFQFIPSQKGANEGRMKLVKQGDQFTVHTTNGHIIIHLKIARKYNIQQRISEFLKKVQELMDILKEYDLSKPTKKNKQV